MLTIEQFKSLNELEMMIYNHIIQRKEAILTMRIKDFADDAHVSTATIIRFCKKAGCDGFAEFKIKYRLYLQHQEVKKESNDASMLIDFFNKVNVPSFYERLDDIAKHIVHCESVIFLGVGSSGILAQYGARYFSNLGKVCFCIDDPFYPILKTMFQNAVCIILSESGENEQTLLHARALREASCYVIGISNREDCTLAKFSDELLSYYIPSEKTYDEYNITSQVPVIFILEALGKKLRYYQKDHSTPFLGLKEDSNIKETGRD